MRDKKCPVVPVSAIKDGEGPVGGMVVSEFRLVLDDKANGT